MKQKEFELSIGNKFYFGEYYYEGNELMIVECNIMLDERPVEIDSLNNKTANFFAMTEPTF